MYLKNKTIIFLIRSLSFFVLDTLVDCKDPWWLCWYYDGINMADRAKAYYAYNIKYFDIFLNIHDIRLIFL